MHRRCLLDTFAPCFVLLPRPGSVNTSLVLDIASGPPSREGWKRLVDALDEREAMSAGEVRSLQGALAPWPEELRAVPLRWATKARSDGRLRLRSRPHAGWALGRTAHWRDTMNDDLAFELAGSPHIARLKAMTLHGSCPGEGLEALMSAPALGKLSWLGLREVDLSGDDGRWLRARSVSALKRLDLRQARLPAGWVAAMGRASWPVLERLHLGHLRVAPDELSAMLTEVRWPSLKRLNLYGSEPTREVLSSLVGNPSSRKLERLTIGALPDDEMTLDPRVLSELLAPKGLRKLRRLTLRGLRIDADLRAILRECDSGLTDLVLRDCEVSDRLQRQWDAARSGEGIGVRVRLR